MRLIIFSEEVNISDAQYKKEKEAIFEEMDNIDPRRLYIQLMILEDTRDELMDGYDSSWIKYDEASSKNWTEYLLEYWRNERKIEHIQERINITSFHLLQNQMEDLTTCFRNTKIA